MKKGVDDEILYLIAQGAFLAGFLAALGREKPDLKEALQQFRDSILEEAEE